MVGVTVFEALVQCLLFSSALIGITQPKVIVSIDHLSCEKNGWGNGGESATAQGMWDG